MLARRDDQAVADVRGEVGAPAEQHVGVVRQRRRERKLPRVDRDLVLERRGEDPQERADDREQRERDDREPDPAAACGRRSGDRARTLARRAVIARCTAVATRRATSRNATIAAITASDSSAP